VQVPVLPLPPQWCGLYYRLCLYVKLWLIVWSWRAARYPMVMCSLPTGCLCPGPQLTHTLFTNM